MRRTVGLVAALLALGASLMAEATQPGGSGNFAEPAPTSSDARVDDLDRRLGYVEISPRKAYKAENTSLDISGDTTATWVSHNPSNLDFDIRSNEILIWFGCAASVSHASASAFGEIYMSYILTRLNDNSVIQTPADPTTTIERMAALQGTTPTVGGVHAASIASTELVTQLAPGRYRLQAQYWHDGAASVVFVIARAWISVEFFPRGQ